MIRVCQVFKWFDWLYLNVVAVVKYFNIDARLYPIHEAICPARCSRRNRKISTILEIQSTNYIVLARIVQHNGSSFMN